MNYIGKILPIEGYRVHLQDELPKNYPLSLSHLYQPLIGMDAIMLYQTLMNEYELHKSEYIQTHHSLMNYLNSPLDQIYKNRLKLEALGLLKTYEKATEHHKVYTYVLQAPYTPQAFFHDPMLSQLLYHHISPSKYDELKKLLIEQVTHTTFGTDITATFSDVFTTFEPTAIETNRNTENKIQTKQSGHQQLPEALQWIQTKLKQQMIPAERVLTSHNKKLINDMMNLYGLAIHDIEKSILWALTETNELDVDEFKAACHDIFKTERKASIHLQPKSNLTKTPETTKQTDQPKSKRDQLIHQFETISPRQLLENLSAGQASDRELKIISDVMTTYGLTPQVMNVLVHYVLIQTNMKLSRPYLESIAPHWSRARLKTATEAMDFVQEQINKAREYKRNPNKRRGRGGQKEVLPEWFKQQQKEQKKEKKSTQKNDETYDEEEILALFHKHSNKK